MSQMSTKAATNFPSSTYKTTTGLVGLAVDTNARNTLLQLTETCLKSVQVSTTINPELFVCPIFFCIEFVCGVCTQRAPDQSGYRVKVEEWMHFIDKSVKMTDDVR